MSRVHVFEWHKRFSRGRDSVEDDEPAGRSRQAMADENIAKIRDMIEYCLKGASPFYLNSRDSGKNGKISKKDL
ncbi:hypothetical protein TNCV_2466841 [Trichonephila clavipes]|nr:hypothetical protein TNCV_2466841 [Trichonephila clavipes]